MPILPEAIWSPRIQRARQIQGWMDELELEWLAEQATRHQNILEVGSWRGRSTVALAANTKGSVIAVDTWKGSAEHSSSLVGPEGQLLQEFLKNTEDLPVMALQMTSLEASQLFGEGSLDMVFIDGSHAYEDVKADILAWRPLLQEGGLLCGHDVDWPSVKRAIDETIGTVKNPVMRIWHT